MKYLWFIIFLFLISCNREEQKVLPKISIIHRVTGHSAGITDIVFSNDGRWMISAGKDAVIKLWEMPGCKEGKMLFGHSKAITDIDITKDGNILASASKDKFVRIWKIKEGKVIQSISLKDEENIGTLNSICFTPDGKSIATGDGRSIIKKGKIQIWKVFNGKLEKFFPGHRGAVNCIRFTPGGSLMISGGWDNSIRIWDMISGKQKQIIHPSKTQLGSINAMAISPDGRILATGGYDIECSVKIWDISSGRKLFTFQTPNAAIDSLAFSKDGEMLAAGINEKFLDKKNGEIKLIVWDVLRKMEIVQTTAHKKSITAIAFDPNRNVLASGSEDHSIIIWQLNP